MQSWYFSQTYIQSPFHYRWLQLYRLYHEILVRTVNCSHHPVISDHGSDRILIVHQFTQLQYTVVYCVVYQNLVRSRIERIGVYFLFISVLFKAHLTRPGDQPIINNSLFDPPLIGSKYYIVNFHKCNLKILKLNAMRYRPYVVRLGFVQYALRIVFTVRTLRSVLYCKKNYTTFTLRCIVF